MKKFNFSILLITITMFFICLILNKDTYEKLSEFSNLELQYKNIIFKQDEKIKQTEEKIKNLKSILIEIEIDHKNKNKEAILKINSIDAAISSKTKRWEKIKKLRKIVKNTITNQNYKTNMNIIDLTKYAGAVVDYSSEYDIPIPLILAVTRQESAFNPKAISHAGAQGLMQLMPETAKECAGDIGKRFYNVFSIRTNVQLGTFYLRKMLTKFKDDVELSIKAYNAGPNYVLKVLAEEYKTYPQETVGYSKKVLKYLEEYQALYN